MFTARPTRVKRSEVIIMKKTQIAKNDVPQNSSMAENMEEMKNLGKQVEQMKTNEELKEENKTPDPRRM